MSSLGAMTSLFYSILRVMFLKSPTYKTLIELDVYGFIHHRSPYTGGFFGKKLPAGTKFKISQYDKPEDEEIQCWLLHPRKLEKIFVPIEERKAKFYDGYSVILKRVQFLQHCVEIIPLWKKFFQKLNSDLK